MDSREKSGFFFLSFSRYRRGEHIIRGPGAEPLCRSGGVWGTHRKGPPAALLVTFAAGGKSHWPRATAENEKETVSRGHVAITLALIKSNLCMSAGSVIPLYMRGPTRGRSKAFVFRRASALPLRPFQRNCAAETEPALSPLERPIQRAECQNRAMIRNTTQVRPKITG